jgi:uncharacterized membrane protein
MGKDMQHSSRYYPNGSGSVVAIFGHPLHPMIVPLPIACLLGAFAADLAFLPTQDTFWSRLSFTLIASGIAAGLLAAVLGAIEAASLQRARSSGTLWAHAAANVFAMIISVGNMKLRWEAEGLWVNAGPYLSAVVAALLVVSGWLGGSLSYKHGIGVSERVGSAFPADNPDLTPSGAADIAHER